MEAGHTYYYLLEEVDIFGDSIRHGPVEAVAGETRSAPIVYEGLYQASGARLREALVLEIRDSGTPRIRHMDISPKIRVIEPPIRTPGEGQAGIDKQGQPDGIAGLVRRKSAARFPDTLKVFTSGEGFFKAGCAELIAAGLPDTADPRGIRVLYLGREVPVEMDGEEDGRCGPQNALIFYGAWPEDERETENVFRVSWGGEKGLRVADAAVEEPGPEDGTRPEFPIRYEACGGEISFAQDFSASAAEPAYSIGGFGQGDVRAYLVENPWQIERVRGVRAGGAFTFKPAAKISGHASSASEEQADPENAAAAVYFVLEDAALRPVERIVRDEKN